MFAIGSAEKQNFAAFVAEVEVGLVDATIAALVMSVRLSRGVVAGWTGIAVTVALTTAETSRS